MATYTTKITQDAEGQFNAAVLYDGRMVPGLPMRSYATRKAANRGAALMLRKAS